ncbi:unnamed protein product, partial [marine sediment metagenome]
ARELSIAVQLKAMAETIPSRRRMAEMEQSEIEDRVRKVQPRLEDQERHRTQIVTRIRRFADGLADDVRREARPQLESLAARVLDWAKAYKPENTIGVGKMIKERKGLESQAEALMTEVAQYLSDKIEDAQSQWQKETLIPMVRRRLEELREDINKEAKRFLDSMGDIHADLSGVRPEAVDPELNEVSGLQRVLIGVGGLVAGGPVGAFIGATMGGKELLKALAVQVAIGFGLGFLGLLNPFVLVAAVIGAGS